MDMFKYDSLFLIRMNKKIRELQKRIVPVLKKNDVIKAGIFGSFARGEEKKTSDLDLLIKFKGKKNLFDFIGLGQDLEHIIHRKVDLVTYKYIHPMLKERILKDEVRIL